MLLVRCFYVFIVCFSFCTFFPALANAALANFSWLPNTETNLAGYKIHYGTSSRNYTNVIDIGLAEPVDGRVHATVDGLSDGENTYYFAATAYTTDGEESGFSTEAVYCIGCDTVVEASISSGADDAEEALSSGGINLSSSDLEMTQESDEQLVGLRFNNLGIPQDATITKAWIQFTVDETTTDFTRLTIEGEHIADAAPFTTSTYNISSRERTLAAVEWQPPAWSTTGASGSDQQTTDLKDIVQEIVSLPNWAADNSMVFFISGEGKRVAESYDGVASAAAVIHVEFSTGQDTVTEAIITSGADDAEEALSSGGINLGSSDLEMTQESDEQLVGLRFNNLDIPQDATITKAWIQFTVDETTTDFTRLTIEGEHVADAAPFTTSSYNISSRERTLAAVEWQPPAWSTTGVSGSDQQTTDLKDIVQEIVSLANWTANNSMVFIISGEGKRVAESYDGVASAAAVLHVEFSTGHENQSPIVNAGTDQSVTLPANTAVLDGTVTDDGLPVDTLQTEWRHVGGTGMGSVTFADPYAVDTIVTFGDPGTYILELTADDGEFITADSTTITILNTDNPSTPPVANNLSVNGLEDSPVMDQLSADNSDGLPLQYTVTSLPSHGTLTVEPTTGNFTFLPTPDYNGTDSFTFMAANDNGESNVADVQIVITPVNDMPVAHPAAFTTQEDTVASGQLTADDPDGDTLTYAIVTNPGQGTASLNNSGSFTYAPAANVSGTDSFSYTVNDGSVNSAPATVTITVNAVNDAPVAINSAITVDAETATSGQLNATDAEGEPLTYFLTSSPNQGTVTISPDGTFIYTAHKDGSGNDSFGFQADDGADTSNIATVYITITPADTPMVIEAGEVNVDHNWVHVDFDGSFTDPVVIARLAGKNDSEPCLVRIDSVTSTGFDLRLQEYDYQDDIHPMEQVSFLVLEAGHYTLTDGTQLEAGSLTIEATTAYDQISFMGQFTTTPVVITSIASVNEKNAVTARVRKMSQAGFYCKIQEQELNRQNHAPETVNYLAWEPSSGLDNGIRYEVAATGNTITHEPTTVEFKSPFSRSPLVVTDMQTTDGGETSSLRTLKISSFDLQVAVEEEQSKDSEIQHTTEEAGFIAILAE